MLTAEEKIQAELRKADVGMEIMSPDDCLMLECFITPLEQEING